MDQIKNAKLILKVAGIYNVLWGAFVILFPTFMFSFAGLDLPRYPEIWQCVGMIVGVYGVGYWIAADDPQRHWVIIFVGWLGKIFGPIGFIKAIYTETFNFKFGIQIIFNDIIWWIPFTYILYQVWLNSQNQKT